jgi:hypothetical protein
VGKGGAGAFGLEGDAGLDSGCLDLDPSRRGEDRGAGADGRSSSSASVRTAKSPRVRGPANANDRRLPWPVLEPPRSLDPVILEIL